MSPEEVAELHANFTRARELQSTPAGTVLVVGEHGEAAIVRVLFFNQ